jgi:hypothetical protein
MPAFGDGGILQRTSERSTAVILSAAKQSSPSAPPVLGFYYAILSQTLKRCALGVYRSSGWIPQSAARCCSRLASRLRRARQ